MIRYFHNCNGEISLIEAQVGGVLMGATSAMCEYAYILESVTFTCETVQDPRLAE